MVTATKSMMMDSLISITKRHLRSDTDHKCLFVWYLLRIALDDYELRYHIHSYCSSNLPTRTLTC